MPSQLHQAYVAILRRRECALELARQLGAPDYPAHFWLEVEAEFADPGNSGVLRHADLALVAFVDGDPNKPALAGILFEPQLHCDAGKAYSWTFYWAALRIQHQCAVWEFIVSPAQRIVRWSAKQLNDEVRRIHVIGRDLIPPVLDHQRARSNLAWATFAAAMHAEGSEAVASARVVLDICATLSAAERSCYVKLLAEGMTENTMTELRASNLPEPIKWEVTEYERECAPYIHGKAEGHREALLAAVEARGLTLSPAQRATVDACGKPSQLDHWLRRLFHVDSAEALFAPE